MQPTPETPPSSSAAPPVVGQSLVEFVRADRQRAAYILMVLSALFLAAGGYCAYKANRAPAAPTADKQKDDPAAPEESEAKARPRHYAEYVFGAILAGLGVLATLAVGGWMLVSPPPGDARRQKTEARAVILGAGGAIGAVLMLAGVVYFYLWSSALFDWLDKGQVKQAQFVLYPLLMIAVGGLLMFLAIQPARAEERDNRLLRRCIYGANLGLSVLLLFVALVVANLIVGPRLPNRLDVTETGFYSLSEGSKEFLAKLPEPIKAYAILPEGRSGDDIRRLLRNCEDASAGKFTMKAISPVADQSEYRTLAGKYPVLESNEVGVLLTVGADEKRHSFIREDEFVQRESRNPMAPQEGGRSFVGEARLMRELLFLAENSQKAVVYFTQSAGELDISGDNPDLDESASGRLIKEYLARNYLEVRPLKFDAKNPQVPDDAAVVVVAEPQVPLRDDQVAALRKYMTETRPGNKKGKLIVLAGVPRFGKDKEVLRTGLEGLLLEFNVALDGNHFIMSDETRELGLLTTIAVFLPQARQARNPVAMALGEKAAFIGDLWRPVAPVRQPGPAFRAVPLLGTIPGRRSWLEDRLPSQREVNQLVADVLTKPEVMQAKQLSDRSRPVGVAVSEGDAGRLVVIGNGRLVSDAVRQSGGDAPGFDLVGGSVDWLRDRPPLTIEVQKKQYVEFKFPPTTDATRGLLLPLLLSMVFVGGLGVGVWMVRRTT